MSTGFSMGEKCPGCSSMSTCQRPNGGCCNNNTSSFYQVFGTPTDPPPPFNSRSPIIPSAPTSCYPFSNPIIATCRRANNEDAGRRKFKCGKCACNISQFLTLVASLFTMVVLIMVYFVPLFNNNNNELGMAPPRLDTASWLQQISLNSWLPDYFNVWSSQSPVIHINQTKIIELRSWTSNDKRSFRRFKMTNNLGISVELCSLGATVTSFIVPDKQGKFNDVVLGFDNAPDYLDDANPYMGATVGRVGNRIARGQFSIDNVTYTLAQNNGNNHLHGGIVGFDAVNWQALVDHDSGSITFSYLSYDGEEGYPGDMLVFAKFTLSPISGALNIEYSATVSKKSPINIVNHMYFNLAGHSAGKQEMLQHTIQINAEYYTPVDAELIPTGEIESVSNTEFDLRVPTLLKEVVGKTRAGQMSGYDTNFVVWPTNMGNAGQNRFVARSVHEKSGRTLEVYSNQPGVQFYTGNFLPTWEESSLIGKHEAMYEQHGAFCLETQMYPDAINQQERFGLKAILSPGEIYYHNVIYSFGLL